MSCTFPANTELLSDNPKGLPTEGIASKKYSFAAAWLKMFLNDISDLGDEVYAPESKSFQ